MEAVGILEVIVTSIELAKAIITIVKDLKGTHVIIQTIHDQVNQMTHQLKHLRRESQSRTLRPDLLEAWLGYQQTCNRTLSRIQEILCSYARHSRTKLAVFNSAKFRYFGGKEELDELLRPIKECNEYFSWLSENILKARLTTDVLNGDAQASANVVPILSLGQHVQLVLQDDAAKQDLS
ncbi:hypothetical protein DL98DRAFT_574047 [Cadophora sp. DSE1049]|nr:hypothetical protein DL98DRAFT_574047 [Cadophora sp. DSE1049]